MTKFFKSTLFFVLPLILGSTAFAAPQCATLFENKIAMFDQERARGAAKAEKIKLKEELGALGFKPTTYGNVRKDIFDSYRNDKLDLPALMKKSLTEWVSHKNGDALSFPLPQAVQQQARAMLQKQASDLNDLLLLPEHILIAYIDQHLSGHGLGYYSMISVPSLGQIRNKIVTVKDTIENALIARQVSYRQLLEFSENYTFCMHIRSTPGRSFNPKPFKWYMGTDSDISVIAEKEILQLRPNFFLPSFRDLRMSEITRGFGDGVFVLGLVDKSTSADGDVFSSNGFFYHDLTHAKYHIRRASENKKDYDWASEDKWRKNGLEAIQNLPKKQAELFEWMLFYMLHETQNVAFTRESFVEKFSSQQSRKDILSSLILERVPEDIQYPKLLSELYPRDYQKSKKDWYVEASDKALTQLLQFFPTADK